MCIEFQFDVQYIKVLYLVVNRYVPEKKLATSPWVQAQGRPLILTT